MIEGFAMKKIRLAFLMVIWLAWNAYAESGVIYEKSVHQPMDVVYDTVYKSLEEAGYYVIFEANMGRSLARNAERWGEDYNRNQLEGIRSMVFCNPWYTNQVSNADPRMLALCPLSITIIHKQGVTTILFERPSVVAEGSPAEELWWEVENDVINAIEAGL